MIQCGIERLDQRWHLNDNLWFEVSKSVQNRRFWGKCARWSNLSMLIGIMLVEKRLMPFGALKREEDL